MTTAAAPQAPTTTTRDVLIVPPKAKKHDIREIALEQLHPHPANRKRFDQAQLEQLADSLVEAGQLTLATVRPIADGFQLLAGERRWRASKLALERSSGHQGRPTLSCVVRELSDLQALQLLASENNQRTDLHPMEEAELYEAFTKIDSLKQERIAKLVGRRKDYIRDRLQLLKLTKDARKLFLEERFTLGHAVILARLDPKDQARAIASARSGNGQIGGLFVSDMSLFDGESDDDETRKPVSVGEFQQWVDKFVGFDPESALVPELFPETAEALEEAKVTQQAVVYITYQDYVHPEAKGDERIVTRRHWKRADGGSDPGEFEGKPTKTCDHRVLGIVKAGPASGLAFDVCVDKKTCAVHWGGHIREAAKRAKERELDSASDGPKKEDAWARDQRLRDEREKRIRAEDARWKKAQPQLLAALTAKIKATPAGTKGLLAQLLLEAHGRVHGLKVEYPLGTTAEDLVRYLAFVEVAGNACAYYNMSEHAAAALKPFGIDGAAIVNQASPKPTPEKKAEAKPAKKRAGDVARARKKAGK
jgi:ParB/RepB/Spo0J family partition protein